MKPLVAITGASSGIGEASARLLSEQGYPLLLLARRVERLESLNLQNCLCVKVDVRDLESFRSAIKKAEEHYGPVDCLVNNAGIMLLGESKDQDPQEWKEMFDVNLVGLLNGVHLVLDSMTKRSEGTIINVSSIAGRKVFPQHAIYCGTKFAVHAMSDQIRKEASQYNVRVITIAPGYVPTELIEGTRNSNLKANYLKSTEPIRSQGDIESKNIADAILFAYQQPQTVCVREVVMAATRQPD